jgi:parvulin-like peptidyl-prolyl isomerase/tetratricopeptide (TPR) repeat protein
MKPGPKDIKEIFAQALQISTPAERASFLDSACKDDPELRGQVESLLEAHHEAGDFLCETIKLPPIDSVTEPRGALIGRYKLLEKIGEGGFGVVYMAEQQEPVQRKVALKIIKAGMDTQEVIARFAAERQALALMDHPNIAKVLDAGATETGRPYFVMELVRGIPITDYCDEKRLSTAERLRLFIKVCQAVQHAHQKAVIHRDLKPSNILVTLHDGEPVPKVIDFGVAKALGQKLTEKTLFTAFRQMIGTPAYMSPEQAEMSGLDIDTRSDIYSLGVLLYELLTGVTPFDKETMAKAALDEIRRMIRETEPPKPSTRLRTLGEKLNEVAKHRQTEPGALSRFIRGDLDWIVMKCLEKDRKRRYETANGVAADLERHLNLEPVLACPPSALYRLGKTVRRHRLAFAAGAGIAISLMAGLALSTTLFVRERAARHASLLDNQRADEQVATALAIEAFLEKDLLAHAVSDPDQGEKPEPDLKVRALLDRASEKIAGQFPNRPLVEAGLRMTLGRAYHQLGEYETMERHLVRAFNLYSQSLGGTNVLTLEAARVLGDAKRHLGRRAEAEQLLQQILDKERTFLGLFHTNTLFTMGTLASTLLEDGQTNKGRALLNEALQLAASRPGKVTAVYADLLGNYIISLLGAGDYREAEGKCLEALEVHRRVYGPESVPTARLLGMLAVAKMNKGEYAKAEPLAREALSTLYKFFGRDSLEVANMMRQLGACAAELHKFSEAESLLADALSIQLKLKGAPSTDVADSLDGIARAFELQGDLSAASALLCQQLEIRRRIQGPQDSESQNTAERLGSVLAQLDRRHELAALLRETLDFTSREGKKNKSTSLTLENWEQMKSSAVRLIGRIAAEQIRLNMAAEAEKLLRKSIPDTRDRFGSNYFEVLMLDSWLNEALRAQGRYAESESQLSRAWRIPAVAGLRLTNDGLGILESPDKALTTLSCAIQAASTNENATIACRFARAALFGRQGLSGQAAEDLVEVVRQNQTYFGLPLVPLWMDSGDVGNYDDYRRRILVRFSRTPFTSPDGGWQGTEVSSVKDPETAAGIALSLMIYPDAASYWATCRLADYAVVHGFDHPRAAYFQMVEALAELRLERFKSAADWARRSLRSTNSHPSTTAAALAVLAMAEHKLGDASEAHQTLARARSLLPQVQTSQPGPFSDHGDDWADWLIDRLLVQESTRVVESAPRDEGSVSRSAGNSTATAAPAGPAARIGGRHSKRGLAAIVNDTPIYESDVDDCITSQEESLRSKLPPDQSNEFQRRMTQLREQCLEGLIAGELILAYALENGAEIPKSHLDEFIERTIANSYNGDSNLLVRALAQKGLTVAKLRELHRDADLVQAASRDITNSVTPPTTGEIEEYYSAHRTNFWDEESIELSYIVINAIPTNQEVQAVAPRSRANQIRARIADGADFAEEADLHSDVNRSRNGGYFGWAKRGILRKELDEAAFSMKKGELSAVIEAGDAFYILRVNGRRPGAVRPLAAVQEEIRTALLAKKSLTTQESWLARLRMNAVILRPPFR